MFGFPKEDYKVFKRNFLRSVILDFQFAESNNSIKQKKDEILKLFRDDFKSCEEKKQSTFSIKISNKSSSPIVENQESTDDEIHLVLKSDNNKKQLEVDRRSIKLVIPGFEYVSFDAIHPLIDKIKSLLAILEVTNVNGFNLRKLNVIEIGLNGDTSGTPGFAAYNEFLKVSEFESPKKNLVMNNITSFQMKNVEQNAQLLVRHGINSSQNIPGHLNHLLIDIDFHFYDKSVGSLFDSIKSANEETFNVYNWLISDKLKNILEN